MFSVFAPLKIQGVLRFGLDGGVPLEPQNPYPFLRLILQRKIPIFRDFFFQNRGLFVVNFWVFTMQTYK